MRGFFVDDPTIKISGFEFLMYYLPDKTQT